MLYDPSKAPMTLDHFIAWLRAKPKNEVYRWQDAYECAFGQYQKAYGLPVLIRLEEIEAAMELPWNSAYIISTHRTFGELLKGFLRVKKKTCGPIKKSSAKKLK